MTVSYSDRRLLPKFETIRVAWMACKRRLTIQQSPHSQHRPNRLNGNLETRQPLSYPSLISQRHPFIVTRRTKAKAVIVQQRIRARCPMCQSWQIDDLAAAFLRGNDGNFDAGVLGPGFPPARE